MNRLQSSWRTLCAVVGDPQLPLQPVEEDGDAGLSEIDYEQVRTQLLTTSPEIAAAHAEIARARAALDRACAEPIPNVSFRGAVNVIDNGIGGKTDGTVGMSFPLPVHDRNQGAIRRAQYELTAAGQSLHQLELQLQSRLAPAFERYANARNQVERFRNSILPAAHESLELTRQMYEAGESPFLALLTAQRTFSQTNLSYLDALLALHTAEIEIEGMLLADSLGNVP